MARRRYRRRFRRTGKWAPNIQEIGTTAIQAPGNTTFFYDYTLANNPTQSTGTTSQTYTVKRIQLNAYIDANSTQNTTNLEDIVAYIMYVPEGMTITADYNIRHPEYIMAYKYLGGPSFDDSAALVSQQYQPIRVSTRLSRKLQTGDSIRLFLKGNNVAALDTSFDFHGLVRWWTKAN